MKLRWWIVIGAAIVLGCFAIALGIAAMRRPKPVPEILVVCAASTRVAEMEANVTNAIERALAQIDVSRDREHVDRRCLDVSR